MTSLEFLVWAKNKLPPIVHRDGTCPSLTRSSIPATGTLYRGQGTVGWLGVRECWQRFEARQLCDRCMK